MKIISKYFILISTIMISWSFSEKEKSVYDSTTAFVRQKSCTNSTMIFSFVGDLLLHDPLQKYYMERKLPLKNAWQQLIPFFQNADFSYANLEGTVVRNLDAKSKLTKYPGYLFDNIVYTGYPRFNYHFNLLESLKQSSIDFVSTANNHALDRGPLGVRKTIAEILKNDIAFAGSFRTSSKSTTSSKNKSLKYWKEWVGSYSVQNKEFYMISCTYATNMIKDIYHEILYCFQDELLIAQLIKKIKVNSPNSYVILFPHYGKEYATYATEKQRLWSRNMATVGADLIVASHPHVIQPWENIKIGNRNIWSIYSLGNFISYHSEPQHNKRTAYILLAALEANKEKVELIRLKYVPIYMERTPAPKIEAITPAKMKQMVYLNARLTTQKILNKENELFLSEMNIKNLTKDKLKQYLCN